MIATPSFNLHGDSHIEQYAVTDLGRGLTDYDDSSTGPAVIDLMRFGVSLHLACRENEWEDHSDSLFNEFIRGYREALENPAIEAPEPAVARRFRAAFVIDKKRYFEWVESEMKPLPQDEYDELLVAMKPYIETRFAQEPDLNKEFYEVVSMGRLKMGIGSALDEKYLVRAQGRTGDPYDDVVLELKEVRDLSGIDCINVGQGTDPFRILLGQLRIAYQPFKHLGYFHFRGLTFWVHSWVENYMEVKVKESFESPTEMAEVAYDVGVQLGKGHVKHIAAPLDLQLRREQIQFIDKHEEDLKKVCIDLAEKTVEAWKKFLDNLK